MKFDNLINRFYITSQRDNNTPEKVFEYETLSMIKTIFDCLESYESGRRSIMALHDIGELLQKLEWAKNLLKHNMKYIRYERTIEKFRGKTNIEVNSILQKEDLREINSIRKLFDIKGKGKKQEKIDQIIEYLKEHGISKR